ncbi:MAG: cache domain-containing protein, partial [Spirochaetaceae bacterium]|nr:cache domain-containing protein [Spirochaetaceae bacterium]
MTASRDATIKHSVFYRTVILTFIPAIIVSCLSVVIYFYYLSWFKSDISHTYSERLQSVAETMDDLVLELYRSHVMLSLDPSIREIVVRSDFPFSERPLDVIRSAKLLGQYRLTREILDSVYIYHRPTGMVLTEQGTVGAAEFFGRLRVYEDRPMESWTSFEHQTARFEFLPPSRVTESDQSARVISIVQEGVGPVRTDSLLVIDIRVEALDRMLASETFTPNSSLAIIDESGTLYASSVGAGWSEVSGFQDWQVIQDYALGHNSTGSRTIALNDGTQSEKAVLIYARSPMSLKRFVYIATVPFSDIRDRTAAIRYIAGLMILVGLATSFGIAVFVTSRQYRPIRALVSLLGRSGEQASESMAADDEYDYLSRNILGVLRAKREMEDELSRAIPLAVERCFVRLLRDDEADLEGDLHALL